MNNKGFFREYLIDLYIKDAHVNKELLIHTKGTVRKSCPCFVPELGIE